MLLGLHLESFLWSDRMKIEVFDSWWVMYVEELLKIAPCLMVVMVRSLCFRVVLIPNVLGISFGCMPS